MPVHVETVGGGQDQRRRRQLADLDRVARRVEHHGHVGAAVGDQVRLVLQRPVEVVGVVLDGPPHAQHPAVEIERRRRVAVLHGHRAFTPTSRLRQPRRRRRGGEAVGRRRIRPPRQRHPTAVAADLASTGALEDRVGARLGGQVEHLRQPELLAGEEEQRAGQSGHQRTPRRAPRRSPTRSSTGASLYTRLLPGPARRVGDVGAAVAGHGALGVVVVQRPRHRRAVGVQRGDGVVDRPAQASRPPTGRASGRRRTPRGTRRGARSPSAGRVGGRCTPRRP